MDNLGTDYLVSHWDKESPGEIDGRKNLWGQPDHVLFRQSFLDLEQKSTDNKSRLDIFLTISTHDPYTYPDSRKYEAFVHRRLAKLPKHEPSTKRLLRY